MAKKEVEGELAPDKRRVVVRPVAFRLLQEMADADDTDPTELANRAIREFLKREGYWPDRLTELKRQADRLGVAVYSLLDKAVSEFLAKHPSTE